MLGPKGKKDKIFYCNKFGFTLCQQNGQRTYGGPPPNWGSRPPPSRDCEVFIGRLPRMCFEDELIPLFLTAGELYEFRLMLDFSGTNRGYGYAHYATPAGAQRAIEKLNKYEIRPGHHIGVLKSKNNCRLLFGNINSAFSRGTFNEFIRTITDQVLNVFMFNDFKQLKQTDFRISSEVEEAFLDRMPRNNRINKFAVVEYENHKAAAVARRILIPRYGHVMAIDWAVPPRERKRFTVGTDLQVPAIHRPMSKTSTNQSDFLLFTESNPKIRPVPCLSIQPSDLFDHVPFTPEIFRIVVKFFKYQLSVALYTSVDRMEIPLFICKEIERKIIDRITNVENCSQAVQLIFNYFSWYQERRRHIVNSEFENLLKEIKTFADSFAFFIKKKLNTSELDLKEEAKYYLYALPQQLNILFGIILRYDPTCQGYLSRRITKGLNWLTKQWENGNEPLRDLIAEIITLVRRKDEDSLDKASILSKSLFLNYITSCHQPENFANNSVMDFPFQGKVPCQNLSGLGVDNMNHLIENQKSISSATLHKTSSNLNSQYLKVDTGHFLPVPFSQINEFNEERIIDANSYPPVPFLLVKPSIMNRVPFMPDFFNNVVIYFKHLLRIYVTEIAWQVNLSHQILNEIDRKIIDRISNMENCSEGVQLILNYLFLCIRKNSAQTSVTMEVHELLKEIKVYADSFIGFVLCKTKSVYMPNDAVENYFCKALPLRLNILFYMMRIFNSENPRRLLIGITRSIVWLEELFQNGDKMAKQFLEELSHYIVESDPAAYERTKSLGKVLCSGFLNLNAQSSSHPALSNFITTNKTANQDCSDPTSDMQFLSLPSIAGINIGPDITFDYYS